MSLLTITSGTYGLYVRKLERFGELFWTLLSSLNPIFLIVMRGSHPPS